MALLLSFLMLSGWEVLDLVIQCFCAISANSTLTQNGCLMRFRTFMDRCPTLFSCMIIKSSIDMLTTSAAVVHQLSNGLLPLPRQTSPTTYWMTDDLTIPTVNLWQTTCDRQPVTATSAQSLRWSIEPTESLIGGFQPKERGDVVPPHGFQRVVRPLTWLVLLIIPKYFVRLWSSLVLSGCFISHYLSGCPFSPYIQVTSHVSI